MSHHTQFIVYFLPFLPLIFYTLLFSIGIKVHYINKVTATIIAMTSASSSSARSLFAESKQRLAERVQVNMNNISSLARQIQRGSKSNELLSKAARDIAATENLMESSEENLKKMQLISVHMGYQFENIHKSAQMLSQISEQVAAMQR